MVKVAHLRGLDEISITSGFRDMSEKSHISKFYVLLFGPYD